MAALSETQKQKCRLYLGYSGRWHQTFTELEQAMDSVNSQAASIASPTYDSANALIGEISAVLDQLAATDKQLIGSSASSYADGAKKRQKFDKAEDVTFRGPVELAALRSEGRMLVNRLALLLGVPVNGDVFGSGASSGGGNGYMSRGS